jgi:hypothetical protein
MEAAAADRLPPWRELPRATSHRDTAQQTLSFLWDAELLLGRVAMLASLVIFADIFRNVLAL